MSDNLTTYAGLLKTVFTPKEVLNLVYQNNQFLKLVPKYEKFLGNNYQVPIIYGDAQSWSPVFATAQSASTANGQLVTDFLVSSRASMYAVGNWTRQTMLASAGDAGAFLEVVQVNIENNMRSLGNALATCLYRSGYGDQGQISSVGFSASALTIQLANPEDVVNFAINQQLDVSATQSGASRARGTSGNGLIVTARDVNAGLLTFGFAINDATNGIPNIAAGDFLFPNGTHSGATQIVPLGIEAYIPPVTPASATTLWGAPVGTDSRLNGLRISATDGRSLEEALIQAAALVAREDGNLSHFFCSHDTYARIQTTMQSRLRHADVDVEDFAGFSGAMLRTNHGEVMIVPDRACPSNRIYGLDLDTWELASLGPLIDRVEEDGLPFIRQTTADNFEARWASYSQLVCRAPGRNVNIQVQPS
jgi:hypothetical protein